MQVPPSQTFLYDDGTYKAALTNSLGSCFAQPGSCANSAVTSVSLASTNLYDAALGAGATAWDTAALNPGLDPGQASTALAALPCYAWGSPAGGYLGGSVAFQRSAWGSAEGAGRVVALPPPAQADKCYVATGKGAWQVS